MENRKSTEFSKKLLALALPAAFQQFMLALVSASDAFMLGALAQDALSAVSLAGQTAFVENLFLAAMTIGLSMFAAQYMGKEDYDSTERAFAYAMKITALISAVFFLAGLCAPKILMRIFTNDGIVKNLTACFCLGLGSGSSIMVGNALGAGKPDTAREYGRKLVWLSVVCGAVSGMYC